MRFSYFLTYEYHKYKVPYFYYPSQSWKFSPVSSRLQAPCCPVPFLKAARRGGFVHGEFTPSLWQFWMIHDDKMDKWWENYGKMMGKWWENDDEARDLGAFFRPYLNLLIRSTRKWKSPCSSIFHLKQSSSGSSPYGWKLWCFLHHLEIYFCFLGAVPPGRWNSKDRSSTAQVSKSGGQNWSHKGSPWRIPSGYLT